jgi:RHS repeat-associated protein
MLAAGSWTRENATGNQFLYNGGTELNGTTGVYDLFFRNYDPVLGRMHQVDPKADTYAGLTPYNYAFNDPAYWNDPWGDEASAEQEAEWKLERERWVQYGSIQAARAAGFRSGMWPSSGVDSIFPRYGPANQNYGIHVGALAAFDALIKSSRGGTWSRGDQHFATSDLASDYGLVWNPYGGDEISYEAWRQLGGIGKIVGSGHKFYPGGWESSDYSEEILALDLPVPLNGTPTQIYSKVVSALRAFELYKRGRLPDAMVPEDGHFRNGDPSTGASLPACAAGMRVTCAPTFVMTLTMMTYQD